MRSLSMLVATCLVLLTISLPVQGADLVNVRLNGDLMSFDTPPMISEGRTMVPLRAIAETFGGQVTWEPEGQFITIVFDTYTLYMKVGTASYAIDGNPYVMDSAPIIHQGRTLVPLRVVGETLGCQVTWDETTRTALLEKEGFSVPEAYQAGIAYTDEDLLWLARIVNVEGLDIGYEAKLAIANVVLNRVKGDLYPDTVYDVIKDKNYAVQFPPAHRSSFDTLEPDAQSYLAAKDALDGLNNIDDCLYFNNAPFKWKADELYKVIDGEYFYH